MSDKSDLPERYVCRNCKREYAYDHVNDIVTLKYSPTEATVAVVIKSRKGVYFQQ